MILLLAGYVSTGLAQDTSAPDRAVGPPPQVVVPARDIELEKTSTPYKIDIYRIDPQLLEQKFAARFRLVCRSVKTPSYLSGRKRLSVELDWIPVAYNTGSRLRLFRSVLADEEGNGSSGRRWRISPYRGLQPSAHAFDQQWSTRMSTSQYFDMLCRLAPEDKRPTATVMDLLHKQADAGLLLMTKGALRTAASDSSRGGLGSNPGLHPTMDVVVMAPNKEQAEQLARALLALFDEGLSRQLQVTALSLRAPFVKDLSAALPTVDKDEKLVQASSKRLGGMPLIDKNALSDFRQRKNLLEIDLAGARARIEAADKLIKTTTGQAGARFDQIMNRKIAAEIDLAGLVAQQQAVTHLMELGQQRATLEFELAKQKSTLAKDLAIVRKIRSFIADYDKLIEHDYRPLELIDNRITICPVQWTSQSK